MANTITLTLPSGLKKWLDSEAKAKGKKDQADYVRELLEREKRRVTRKQLEALLEEGLDSGPSRPADEAMWKRIHANVAKRQKKRAKGD